MWIKSNNKIILVDVDDYFINLGNIESEVLKKIIDDSKVNEVLPLSLPKIMIPDIEKAFTLLDHSSRGTLGPRDVKVTLRALGIEPTLSKIKKLIGLSSIDKQIMELSCEEYETMVIHILNDVDSEEQMIKAFHAIANDNKYSITFKDLKKTAEKLQLKVADEELKEMIDVADSTKDGNVTLEEFIHVAQKIF